MGSPLSVWHQDWIGVWGVCWLGPCFVLFVVFAVVCGSWLDCPVRMAAATGECRYHGSAWLVWSNVVLGGTSQSNIKNISS